MNRHVRAQAPRLLSLAQQSKYASLSVDVSNTLFTKKANVVNLDSINYLLVKEAIKLGSAVLQSISASTGEELLQKSNKGYEEADNLDKPEETTKLNSFDVKKGLMAGAALSAVPLLAANYTINKASDDLDAKMMAIPGLAAATVGAILAARSLTNNPTQPNEPSTLNSGITSELESALNAKAVVDTAIQEESDYDVVEDLKKMSSISTEHIAALISDILL